MRKPRPRLMMLLASLLCGVSLAACQQTNKTTSGLNDRSPEQRQAVTRTEPESSLEPAGLADLDLGQDWDARADRRSARNASTGTNLPRPAGSMTTSDNALSSGSAWVVVLGTFSGDNHQQAAQNMIREIRSLDPVLSSAWVHPTERGSVVAVGRFDSPDDPGARSTLDQVKSIDIGGKPLFARAMLSRVTFRNPSSRNNPYALASVRQRYPNVDPLYSLDVALWIADDDDARSYDQVRRSAEAYVQQLRAQGFEAYFHHDDARRMSSVTVGLFDHRAVDPQSGLLSTDVMALRDRFPARQVNGEPLRLPLDPKRPELGSEVQKPFLVLVPD